MRIDVEAVLFDSDGVLVDSGAHVDEAWSQLASEFDLDIEILAGELAGVRAIDTLGQYLNGSELNAAVDRLEDLEIDLATKVRALPGAVDLCAALPSGTWTVVTSASRRLGEARWNGAGIRMPQDTITADDVVHGKPDPEPYERAAMLLRVNPQQCVVFEDSPSGAESARRAGATLIAVGDLNWNFEPFARIEDLSAVSLIQPSSTLVTLDIH